MFWSSVDLTGNQTLDNCLATQLAFWSSVDLTGNQTGHIELGTDTRFWSSVDLTGNQTSIALTNKGLGFGAVSI